MRYPVIDVEHDSSIVKVTFIHSRGDMTQEELISLSSHLPASCVAEEVNQRLREQGTVVVTAPPGAGKSTLLPLTIMLGLQDGGRVLMLEPRRLAARQIAERMAHTLGQSVGQTVGYRVRFESCVSRETRVEVLTEGILTRMLVDDVTLDGVSVVIFDEFHERSLHSDLALALVRQARQVLRPDLRIVIMSATIDTAHICQALHAPLVKSEGRMFPVQVRHADEDVDPRDIARTVCRTLLEARRQHDGDLLAFLPGQREIEQCQQLLGDSIPHVYPLYGNLSPERQRQAVAPSASAERKVVLATPIAETSLTIEGVRVVVDSGLCRRLVYDARTGLSHLDTVRISLDMATQRAGRAGRVAPGVCYRLWTLASEHRMQEQRQPEIAEADLTSLVLDILAFGEGDPLSLPWLDAPPASRVAQARALLESLGAADEHGITALGLRMAALPCHPRMARMMLGADDEVARSLACDLAALLEEKDPLGEDAGTDLCLRLDALRSARSKGVPGRWARVARVAAEYRRLARVGEDNSPVCPDDAGRLLSLAYPERIAQAQDSIGTFRLANGDLARIDTADPMSAHPWVVVASLHSPGQGATAGSRGRVFLAAPLDVERMVASGDALAGPGALASERDRVAWDSRQGCVVMQREVRIGRLVVSSKPIHDAHPAQIVGIVCEAVRREGLTLLDWNAQVQALQRRVAQVALWHPDMQLPNLDTPHLLDTAAEWLPFYLQQGSRVRQSVAELKRLCLRDILWALLSYDQQQAIDRLAPTHIQVPTGSRIGVEYRLEAGAPVLSVRLQECFGMSQTPSVDDGRQPVLMELLSPGYKPVQLTQDLASFWQTTYYEVRKELKRRYPKHYWPENPQEAEAVRGVRRSGASAGATPVPSRGGK